jgi:hypothetical protein
MVSEIKHEVIRSIFITEKELLRYVQQEREMATRDEEN